MFNFIVRYFGFLKHIPLLPHVFDAMLKIVLVLRHSEIASYLDEIEDEVLSWNEISLRMHKYGGIQFDINKREIGHIHGNGLLDILFSREDKARFMAYGRVQEHHVFKNSGWVSLYIQTSEDRDLAIQLLRYSYAKKAESTKGHPAAF